MVTDHRWVRIIPLGGLGEIGMNCLLLETEEDILVVDCGLMFPEEELYGIDLVIPDFAYLLERRGKVRGIVLTHGHEDHTGALPYLLRDLQVPVYGTRLSLGLLGEKLEEFELSAELRPVRPRGRVRFGSLEVEFIQVCHSIPDGVAVAVETPAGLVLHTGDFKFDASPIDGRLTDYSRLSELGDRGVLALLSDSTNATRAGFTPSERVVGAAFEGIFRKARGRIIVACFASNIHRIQQVFDTAARFDRKVAISGKSMVANVRVALELGYLSAPEEILVPLSELMNLSAHRGVILTTGSQGEPLSALARMASGEHKQIQVQKGDTVIFSARVIPGHEKDIARTINQLMRRGAEVLTEEDGVHVSGHGSQEELKLMLNLVKPRFFIPAHGEFRHLSLHAKLAEEVGIPQERIFVAEDGDVLELTPSSGKFVGKVEAGRIFVDGKGVGDVGGEVLRDRQRLAQEGLVLVVLGFEKGTGRLITGPEVLSRGFAGGNGAPDLFQEVGELIRRALEGLSPEERVERHLIEQRIKDHLKRFFQKALERRPMIVPVIVQV